MGIYITASVVISLTLLGGNNCEHYCYPLLKAIAQDIRAKKFTFPMSGKETRLKYTAIERVRKATTPKYEFLCIHSNITGQMLNENSNEAFNDRRVDTIQQAIRSQQQVTKTPLVRYGMPHDLAPSTSDCKRNWTHKGWDADIIYTLAAHTGTLDGCIRVDRAEVYPNGTHFGGMLNLTRGEVDIYGASRYHEHSLGNLVSYLYPHRQEDVCLATKRLAIEHQVSLPSFSANIWAATASVLFLFLVIVQFVHGVGFVPAIFAIVHTFIVGGFDFRYGRVMVWLSVFSFVMMNFLSGTLVGSLVSPDRESEIDSLKEIDAKHDIIYSTPVAAETVFQVSREDDPTVYSLGQKVKIVRIESERRKALYETGHLGTAALISGSIGLDAMERTPVAIRNGYSLLHRVKECLVTPAYYAFHVRRNWPLIKRFNDLVQRLVEGEIIAKMFAKNLDLIIKDHHTLPLLPGLPSAPYEPISLVLLFPLFLFWLGNLVFALLVFILEICFKSYCKRRVTRPSRL